MKWLCIPVVLAFTVLAQPVVADGKSHDACAEAFDACMNDCNTRFADDTAGRAACVPQCSGNYAACDAGVAYDKAKPWFEEQAKKTKKFFDDMIQDLKKQMPEEPAPQKDKSI